MIFQGRRRDFARHACAELEQWRLRRDELERGHPRRVARDDGIIDDAAVRNRRALLHCERAIVARRGVDGDLLIDWRLRAGAVGSAKGRQIHVCLRLFINVLHFCLKGVYIEL